MLVTYDSLLGSAVEYFTDSIEFYKNQKYKNAVISLWSGILILLKCKLFKAHPALIAANIADLLVLNDRKLEIPNLELNEHIKTVRLSEMLKRFKKFGISNEVYNRYAEGLVKIQTARNQAEHCICSFSSDDFLEMFENVVPFVNDFFEEELNTDPADIFKNWSDFLAIQKLAKARQKNVTEFIDKHTDIEALKMGTHISAACSECGAEAIDIGDKMLTCRACGNKEAYNVCRECGGVFPENGFVSFYEELGLCYDCFAEKSGMNDDD